MRKSAIADLRARASKDERPGPSPFEARRSAERLRVTE